MTWLALSFLIGLVLGAAGVLVFKRCQPKTDEDKWLIEFAADASKIREETDKLFEKELLAAEGSGSELERIRAIADTQERLKALAKFVNRRK